ncbi:MAG: M15 family metallopeptidase [Prevotellaceae bacterium]|nr:M15 family metallopeptidase [Prevotellaceae bacterium]
MKYALLFSALLPLTGCSGGKGTTGSSTGTTPTATTSASGMNESDTSAENEKQDETIPAATPVKSRTACYLDSLGLVNIVEADSSIRVNLMYARADNLTGHVLYEDLREGYLHPDAMKCLIRAQQLLKAERPGYSLLVHDAARPMSVQQQMWDAVKGTPKYRYVANPANGGGMHNYGLAVDISILDDKGTPLPMGTPVDYLGVEAHITDEAGLISAGKLTEQERENRELLRKVMREAGFRALPHEWWHFNLVDRETAMRDYQVIP